MQLVKFVNGSAVKVTFEKYEAELAALGWVREEAKKEEPVKEVAEHDRAALLAEAEALGLSVHHRTGDAKLAELIAQAKLKQE